MNQLDISFTESCGVINLGPQPWSLVTDAFKVPEVKAVQNKPNVTYEELELIEALRKGEEAAFGTLIDRYHSRLLRLARTFVSSQALAEEVVQATWMAVLEGIDRFEGRSSLKTWIFKILKNLAKTKGKRESRYLSFSDATSPSDQESDLAMDPERFHTSGPLSGHSANPHKTCDEHTPERLLLSKEILTQIEQSIHALPSTQRQVIILRDIEGLDSEKICQILNITKTHQRVLLHRARATVRWVLSPYLQGHSHKTLAASV